VNIIAFRRKNAFWLLVALLGLSFFNRNNTKSVETIAPETLQEPLQTPVSPPQVVRFSQYGYDYELEALYQYEINAMLVHKLNYRTFSIHNYDKIFPFDVCLIWGENLSKKIYRAKTLSFSQDCRFCWADWREPLSFGWGEISNNHLLVTDKRLERILASLVYGDQIKIRGRLVNVRARPSSGEGAEISWRTSVSRTDGGAGACEVILVEDIRILKKANVFWRVLFPVSLYGLLLLIFWGMVSFFSSAVKRPFKDDREACIR